MADSSSPPPPPRKPTDAETDVHGLTHTGKVRANNQDQFLMATIHRRVDIVSTSLTEKQRLPFGDERLAYIAMVADGVGGGPGGEHASALALEIATQYVVNSLDCYYSADANQKDFINVLQAAAMNSHDAVLRRAEAEPELRNMATTLTVYMGLWPDYYILQVGDSRYYLFRNGKLTQVTRDQTLAQDLVDEGVLSRAAAQRSTYTHILSSSIGGGNTAPTVTRLRADWNNVHLMCSDGLTKHVSDEQIAARLSAMTSSKQVCEQLLQDALDGGGTDNITIIVGRARIGAKP
jgi:protein phosphatase